MVDPAQYSLLYFLDQGMSLFGSYWNLDSMYAGLGKRMSDIVEGAPVEKMGTGPVKRRMEVGLRKRPCLLWYSGCRQRLRADV